MATGRIDSFYNLPELTKEQQQVQAMLERTLELMAKVQAGQKTLPKIPGGSGPGTQAKRETDALTRANEALKQSLQATNVQLQAYKAQTTINNAESRQMAKAVGLVGGAYDKLSGQLEIAKKNYRNLAAEEKHLSDEGMNLQKNIAAMDAKIKAIDASMGNHQRNVGNYSSAFNGLNNSINQVTRELPAFTVSAQTGFLAISNNLPILADAIKGVRTQNAALAAEGKPTTSVLKQLAGAVFSWGTALSLGITLLTVYGGQIVKWLSSITKSADELDKLKLRQEDLNSVMSNSSGEYQKAIKSVSELTINIGLAKKGFLDKKEVLKQYNETIHGSKEGVESLDIAEKELVKAGPAFIKMMLYKAAAQIALEDAAKKTYDAEVTRQKKLAEFTKTNEKASLTLSTSGYVNQDELNQRAAQAKRFAEERKAAQIKEAEDAATAQLSIAEKFQQDAAELANQFNFDFFGGGSSTASKTKLENAKSYYADYLQAVSEQQKIQLQTQAETQDRIQADEKQSLSNRLEALKLYVNAKQYLIANDAATEIQDLNSRRESIVKDYKEKIDQAKANKESTSQLEKAMSEELISFDQYATQQRLVIRDKATKQFIDLELEVKEKQKNIWKNQPDFKGPFPIPEALKKQAQDYLNQSKKTYDDEFKLREEFEKKKRELLKQTAEMEWALGAQTVSVTNEFIQGAFDRKKNAIQDEIDLITERSNAEIEAVNNSSRTEQQKADAITAIRASAQSRKESLELRQRKIDEQKARFERLFQIFEISLQTIKAVAAIKAQAAILSSNPATAALASLAYAQIPLAIASGALSIGAILAKPIPKFATGTKDSPEGVAWVGEKGTEGRINPDGSFELTPNRPTLTYLQKGTEIIPNNDLMAMLPALAMNQEHHKPMTEEAYAALMVQRLSEGIVSELRDVKAAINNKKETHYNWTDDGFKASIKKGKDWFEYLNRGWND